MFYVLQSSEPGARTAFASEPKWVSEICSSPPGCTRLRKLAPEVVRHWCVESTMGRLRGGRGRARAGGTDSTLKAGSGKNVQDPHSKGHLAYWLPGPGRMARCLHRLPPVCKTTLGKPKDKREPPQRLTLQLCSASNSCFHPSEGIPAPSVHSGFRHLFQMPTEVKVASDNCVRSTKDTSGGFSPKHYYSSL